MFLFWQIARSSTLFQNGQSNAEETATMVPVLVSVGFKTRNSFDHRAVLERNCSRSSSKSDRSFT